MCVCVRARACACAYACMFVKDWCELCFLLLQLSPGPVGTKALDVIFIECFMHIGL